MTRLGAHGPERFRAYRRFRFTGLILLLLSVFFVRCSPEPEKPNVIIFLVDDFGYGDISYEGNTQIQTPNIDRIAKAGVRFTRFYQSGAACAPTRAAILCGRYALSTGVWDVHYGRDFLRRDERTIAQALKEAGYTTGAFGKWHSGKTNSYFSWNRGFDVALHPKLYMYYDNDAIYNNKLVHYDGPVADLIGDEVVRFIETNKDKPFFAYVPFQDIHEPFNCSPELFEKYKSRGYSDHVARLYGMIEAMDNNVGKVLDAVKRAGLERETLIVFLGDDGPSPGVDLSYSNRRMNPQEQDERSRAWSRRLRGQKGTLWEGGVITPCYMAWPGHIQAGSDIPKIAGVIDLYPTILDACRITNSQQVLTLDGRSLWPLIKGQTMSGWDERFYFDNSNFYQIPREAIDLKSPQVHYLSVQHKQFKMIREDGRLYRGGDSIKYYLFDLSDDPEEKRDISDQHPELTQLLKDTLHGWFVGVLRSGRAFYQAEYPVGEWQERETPINTDAMSNITGSLKRKSLALISGWDQPGNSLAYPIDVLESGVYAVELNYHTSGQSGAVFRVYTPVDTAHITVADPRQALSGSLNLPRGPQVLTLELISTGNQPSAVDATGDLVVRRLPLPADSVLTDLGFTLRLADGSEAGAFHFSSATADFQSPQRNRDSTLTISVGQQISVIPRCNNMSFLKAVRIYYNFALAHSATSPPANGFELTLDEPGKHTINVEFESTSGVMNAVYGRVHVK